MTDIQKIVKPSKAETGAPAFLREGGDTGQRIAAMDWSSTPLGALADWPASLRTAASMMVRSRVPVALLWGDEGILLYNDAYSQIAGDRHPAILGTGVVGAWPEAAEFNADVLARGLSGESLHFPQIEFQLHRDGAPRNFWFDLDYSPIVGEDGEIAGIFALVVDTTERVHAERRLRAVLDGMGESLAVLDHDFRIIDMNAEALRMEPRAREEIIGKTHWEAYGDAIPELGALFRKAMAQQVPVSLEHRYAWADGRESWIAMRASPIPEGLAVFYRDITEEKQATQRLESSEERYRSLFEAIDEGFCVIEFFDGPHGPLSDYVHVEANSAYAKNAGIADVVGQSVRSMVPDEADGWVKLYGEVLRTGTPIRFERELVATGRHLELAAFRVEPPELNQVAVLFKDMTERKRFEEHQQLLINELSHRAKNLLAIVQGVAHQSFRGSRAPEEMRAAFEGRLGALAAAHDILTHEKWEHVPIRPLIDATLAAVSNGVDRFDVDGPEVELPPKTGVSLAMAVHELATNALKYGSLSVPGGRVTVRWTADDGRLRLRWEERGGPPVEASPKRGFGTRMIERGLSAELGGAARITFDPAGLVCTVDAPLPAGTP